MEVLMIRYLLITGAKKISKILTLKFVVDVMIA